MKKRSNRRCWSRNDLRDYAQSVYTSQRAAYVGQLDATRQQLAQVQALQACKDRVEALGKLLEALAKKESLTEELSAMKQTVTDTKTDFDKLICDGLLFYKGVSSHFKQ